MSKGILDTFVRSEEGERRYAEEKAVARVALRMADLLQKVDVTQRELARRVGVTEGRISQILRAENNPTVKTIARIAQAVGYVMDIEFRLPREVQRGCFEWSIPRISVSWSADVELALTDFPRDGPSEFDRTVAVANTKW